MSRSIKANQRYNSDRIRSRVRKAPSTKEVREMSRIEALVSMPLDVFLVEDRLVDPAREDA